MSRHGVILDTSPPQIAEYVAGLVEDWPHYERFARFPRSLWLSHLETGLAFFYPRASSRDRNLTARSLAPFTLKEHP